MSFLGNIKMSEEKADPTAINPVSLFYQLEHPSITDLYPVQDTVLKNWYEKDREGESSTIISLDTGTGKTLVGLLIAESIRLSEGGKVLYVCPNNYLISQTVEKAEEYGIAVSVYKKGKWKKEEDFLQNEQICITNYDSIYNSRSIFSEMEIAGCIFDDAHLSLEIIDRHYTLRIDRSDKIYEEILRNLKPSSSIEHKIEEIEAGDPRVNVIVPLPEWHSSVGTISSLLGDSEGITSSLEWRHLRSMLNKTICFISPYQIEITLLYPNIQNHFLFGKKIKKVYLSATLPNRDDLKRIFNEEVYRIDSDNPDYRPERLFIFSSLLKEVEELAGENILRTTACGLSSKSLVLVPRKDSLEPYSHIDGAIIVDSTEKMEGSISSFKDADSAVLALMNRYDGIDLPGNVCHNLILDGQPFVSSLKTKFFSEYFHNQKNSFLRSIMASKLVQAFGRTVRGHKDYSIVFLIGDKLNRWLLNKDNNRFFREDVVDDFNIGIQISRQVKALDDLKDLSSQMLEQTSEWKDFIKENRKVVEITDSIDLEKEKDDLEIAKIERDIIDAFYSNDYEECIRLIQHNQIALKEYAKPILGLYLSLASICCLELGNKEDASKYSAQAYGINPIFGEPLKLADESIPMQSQRIMDESKRFPDMFIWEEKEEGYGNQYDEDMRVLGEWLGFTSSRPETESDGTLDVLWVDEEQQRAIGIELKVDKTNTCLSKDDISQCHDHSKWLEERYPDFDRDIFILADVDSYNALATPGELKYVSKDQIKVVTRNIRSIYENKEAYPERTPSLIVDKELTLRKVFPSLLVKELEAVKK